MEIIYNLSTFLFGLLILIGPFALLSFILKPHLYTKILKKTASRKQILKRGLISGLIALFVLLIIGIIFEPASVKAERLAKEKAETAQKALVEKRKLEELQPVKKTVETKSKLSFKTVVNEDGALPKDEKKTSVEGSDGERTKIYEVTYVKGVETARKLIKDEVTKPPIDKIVLVGTYVAPAPAEIRSVYSAPAPAPSSSVYFANCTAARAAGAAPLYTGQPGYRSGLDRDSDGVACE